MGSSGKAFDEVKAILGKLDRSIDQARHKRLGPDEVETSENHGTPESGLIGRGELEELDGDRAGQLAVRLTELASIKDAL